MAKDKPLNHNVIFISRLLTVNVLKLPTIKYWPVFKGQAYAKTECA